MNNYVSEHVHYTSRCPHLISCMTHNGMAIDVQHAQLVGLSGIGGLLDWNTGMAYTAVKSLFLDMTTF